MKTASQTRKQPYRSDLRAAQADLTREKIGRAAADLLQEKGGAEGITFKAVAARAGVTEMTVYRHFPTREALLHGLWRHINDTMGPDIGMPESADALLRQHDALFAGFDRVAPQIVASITTAQGREMRASLNRRRRKAFLAIVDAAAPGLDAKRRTAAASILQLLHSAYAWDSLREQWSLDGPASGEATKWAIKTLLKDLRRKK